MLFTSTPRIARNSLELNSVFDIGIIFTKATRTPELESTVKHLLDLLASIAHITFISSNFPTVRESLIMLGFRIVAAVTLVMATSVAAASIRAPKLPSAVNKRAPCSGNTADNRGSWCDFSIDTDWYNEVPDTGVTREYWLELVETDVSPDGFTRSAMTVNGSIPGPTIVADWGDNLVIHVINNLNINGTSIHWHGLRQNFTNQNDGVVSITQCAQAPKDVFTYRMRATQYGTTWYHSHFSLQAWDGVFGSIVINGPATANYDVDVGPIIIADWFHESVYSLATQASTSGPPTPENGLINGTNVFGDDGSSDQTGSRFELSFEAGSSYRLRLINVAIDSFWKFMIDNHTLTVIAIDLVPVEPFTTNIISIGIGKCNLSLVKSKYILTLL